MCSIHSAVCNTLYKFCGNFCFLTFMASKRSRLCSLIRNTLKKQATETLSLPLFCRVTQEGGSPSGSRTSTRKGPKGEGYRGETQRKSRNKKVKHVIFKCVNRKRYFCNVWKLKMIFYGLFTFWYVYSYNMFNCELKISIQQIKTNVVPEELIL